ncbi:hypothetical protein KJ761_03335, partial [Patescibacteria group bacterium]|nr:hypothetical protein [Patescibacteria group bacterium]
FGAPCAKNINVIAISTASCSVSPNPVPYGGNPGITLNSTNGYYCHVYNDWREVQSGYFTSGTYYPGAQTTPGVHQGEVYCYNSAWVGSGWSTCNYTVSPPPAPTLTFTGTYGSQVNQTTLNLQSGPGDVTLNWTTNASTTFCDAWGGDATWDAYNPASAGGSSVRTVPATLTYYMECWNAVNVSTGVKTVQVNVCNPNCSDSDSHCHDTTYTGNCGQTCDGTLPNSCGGWGSCSKECGGGVQIQDCVCPTKTKTRSCSSRPCPPSYKEVAPW